ncbi:hypothetical protein [Nannocystis punicea]|uniref:VWFA domain-containing protein n=1 Tax=Nannocystis punicea TaxID=2995304 RepID=A0ABY7HBF2_9BACT|nr:hypothetical protein [Nannocystis poenicansa]WAS96597.1 hypothetical protein O0S08_10605 [Nannocystis poenicansa]
MIALPLLSLVESACFFNPSVSTHSAPSTDTTTAAPDPAGTSAMSSSGVMTSTNTAPPGGTWSSDASSTTLTGSPTSGNPADSSSSTTSTTGPETTADPSGTSSTTGPGTTTQPEAGCGNGEVEPPEACDDGNDLFADDCWPTCEKSQCGDCSFARPNVLFVLDYSTSMNSMWGPNETRYSAITGAITDFLTTQPALAQRINVAFLRYGHDPNVQMAGTLIQNDSSGIMDGQKIDLSWTEGGAYLQCQHENLAALITSLPPPINGSLVGIGTWTKGALDRARGLIQAQRAEFIENKNAAPYYRIILITDGQWTDPSGTQSPGPANQNPSITAGDLYMNENVMTHVITLGEASGKLFANELATAGGTGQAVDAMSPGTIDLALGAVFAAIDSEGIVPGDCST